MDYEGSGEATCRHPELAIELEGRSVFPSHAIWLAACLGEAEGEPWWPAILANPMFCKSLRQLPHMFVEYDSYGLYQLMGWLVVNGVGGVNRGGGGRGGGGGGDRPSWSIAKGGRGSKGGKGGKKGAVAVADLALDGTRKLISSLSPPRSPLFNVPPPPPPHPIPIPPSSFLWQLWSWKR